MAALSVGSLEVKLPTIWTVGVREEKKRLAKAAGAKPAGQMRDEKLHAVVAGSTFPSQNVQSNVGPLLEVEMSKSARRCGAKHVSKSKV